MPGGYLSIISLGNGNVFLTGNPSKTFFKVTYAKYTNFGMQKFRLDYEGLRDLRLSEESKFTFKIKRYADLLMDTYLVVNLPDIWSPIWEPNEQTGEQWSPYEFKWIENIGVQMISQIELICGSVTLQKYSGQYLAAMIERDFSGTKKLLINDMTGNIPELTSPSRWNPRINTSPAMNGIYPSAIYEQGTAGAEPSIRGRSIYVPLNTWFSLDSRCAFPLISLQYQELQINVTLRPIQELIQVRDVFNPTQNFPYVRPDLTLNQFQLYRFLQTPPSTDLSTVNYENQVQTWNSDVHLLSTYCFLSNSEQELFAAEDQIYLVKDIYEYDFLNILGTSRVNLMSTTNMVAGWMWYFQRNDAFLRNEWSNYTNWIYNNVLPDNLILDETSGLFVTGPFSTANQREIMETMAIVLSGDYREQTLPSGVFNYIEKYIRTTHYAKEGLYCYNFCLNTNPFEYQPSGAMNMSKFKNIELEFTTYQPPFDKTGANFDVTCDEFNNPISVTSKPSWALYTYNYNLHVMEERYNILSFIGGNCGMMYAR